MQNARGFEYGVRHILSPFTASLSEAVCTELNISADSFHFLLNFGAIYFKGQRTLIDVEVHAGDYIRVHTKPRRFPVQTIQWQDTIVFDHNNFVVLNKPAGIPVHPTVDNIQENILAQLEKIFGFKFYVTHRLDVPTQGLIVFAKNKEFQSLFNKLLIDQKVTKKYKALCEGHLQKTGIIQHYMEPSPRGPKVVSSEPQDNWQECLLEIEACKTLNDDTEATIKLITGRTHQIRAQLAALGHPIVGDHAYGAKDKFDLDRIELKAFFLEFSLNSAAAEPIEFSENYSHNFTPDKSQKAIPSPESLAVKSWTFKI